MRLDLATLVLSTATFVVTLAPAAFAGDDHRCSYRSVAGPFGYTTSGTRAGTPVAGAGIATFEEDGTLEGEQTISFGGTIAHETYSGTYSVDDDCRGSFSVVVTSSIPQLNRTTTVDLVFENNSNAAHGIFTTAGTVITADARKLFPHP
jgi:hypothetical protein